VAGTNASGLWAQHVSTAEYQSKRSVLYPAEILYAEAVTCYNAEAYLACCICARGSIEAALHQAKTRTAVSAGGSVAYLENTQWGQLKTWAKNQGLLEGLDVENARELGNLGAHLAQRLDKANRSGGAIKIAMTKSEAWDTLITCVELIDRIVKQRWS
jgi:hypothetical protein